MPLFQVRIEDDHALTKGRTLLSVNKGTLHLGNRVGPANHGLKRARLNQPGKKLEPTTTGQGRNNTNARARTDQSTEKGRRVGGRDGGYGSARGNEMAVVAEVSNLRCPQHTIILTRDFSELLPCLADPVGDGHGGKSEAGL